MLPKNVNFSQGAAINIPYSTKYRLMASLAPLEERKRGRKLE